MQNASFQNLTMKSQEIVSSFNILNQFQVSHFVKNNYD